MPNPNTYDLYQLSLMPTAQRGPFGEARATAQGLLKDGFPEAAIAAVKCRWASTCPEDALAALGFERLLPRNPGEGTAAFRARLLLAWLLWPFAGTRQGLITALNILGFANVLVFENAQWTVDPSPGFSAGQEWWRFWVVIDQPHGFVVGWRAGDGTLVGSNTIGFGSAPIAYPGIRPTIKQWKPAHALLVSVIVILSGKIVGGGWAVGDGTLVGGATATI